MKIGNELQVIGRVENQGLPFELTLEVTSRGLCNTLLLTNILNNDTFILNLDFGTITATGGGFFSDCFSLINITDNIRII